MNPLQQKVVSEKIAKDKDFVNAYMNEVSNQRNLRVKSLDVAYAMLSRIEKEGARTAFDSKELTEHAEIIYKFLTSDGGLMNIENPIIQSFS